MNHYGGIQTICIGVDNKGEKKTPEICSPEFFIRKAF